MSPPVTSSVYRREDGRFSYRLTARNGQIVATDGGQGYENAGDAGTIVDRLERGYRLVMALELAGYGPRQLDAFVRGFERATIDAPDEATG